MPQRNWAERGNVGKTFRIRSRYLAAAEYVIDTATSRLRGRDADSAGKFLGFGQS